MLLLQGAVNGPLVGALSGSPPARSPRATPKRRAPSRGGGTQSVARHACGGASVAALRVQTYTGRCPPSVAQGPVAL